MSRWVATRLAVTSDQQRVVLDFGRMALEESDVRDECVKYPVLEL